MIDSVPAGSTNVSVVLTIFDVTDGTLFTGAAYDDAGIKLSYKRGGLGDTTAITPATLASEVAAHSDGGFVECDAVNGAGAVRLDLVDAACATGVRFVDIFAFATAWQAAPFRLFLDPIPDVIEGAIVTDGSNSTTQGMTDLDYTVYPADQLNRRTILFRSGSNAGCQAVIEDVTVDGSNNVIIHIGTKDALPNAMANADQFVILNTAAAPGDAIYDQAGQSLADYDPPTDAEMLAAHTATDADIAAVQTLAAASAAWGAINSGIVFRGPVSAADPGVSFTIGGLAGQGAGAFIDANTPWYAYVFRDAGGAGGAPQGEVQQITGYTSATGLFTTAAFTVPVAVGDDIIIMSGRIAAIPEILADTGTTIPAQLAAAHVATDALIAAVSGKLPAFVGLKKGTAIEDFTIPMRDADGDLVSGLTVTGVIKKDGGAFAALTSTITEDGSTGMYDLTTSPALSASEMNADQVVLLFTATGAKPTIIQIFTES
jgi:hypothetical protein